jgi:hypothetical protein
LRLAQQRAQDAEQSLYDLLARYRAHQSTITELLDAQTAHADARTALYQAVTDYETARVRLAVDPTALSFTPEPVPAAPASEVCTEREAPVLSGLRLGAALDELRSQHPGLAIPAPDERGVVTVEASAADLAAPAADDAAFDLAHATLKFFHGRLYSSRIVFSPAVVWTTKDAFLTAAAGRFHLHGPWRAFYDWSDRAMEDSEDIRELAAECDGFRVRLGLGYFSEGVKRVATPHIRVEDTRVLGLLRSLTANGAAGTQ